MVEGYCEPLSLFASPEVAEPWLRKYSFLPDMWSRLEVERGQVEVLIESGEQLLGHLALSVCLELGVELEMLAGALPVLEIGVRALEVALVMDHPTLGAELAQYFQSGSWWLSAPPAGLCLPSVFLAKEYSTSVLRVRLGRPC